MALSSPSAGGTTAITSNDNDDDYERLFYTNDGSNKAPLVSDEIPDVDAAVKARSSPADHYRALMKTLVKYNVSMCRGPRREYYTEPRVHSSLAARDLLNHVLNIFEASQRSRALATTLSAGKETRQAVVEEHAPDDQSLRRDDTLVAHLVAALLLAGVGKSLVKGPEVQDGFDHLEYRFAKVRVENPARHFVHSLMRIAPKETLLWNEEQKEFEKVVVKDFFEERVGQGSWFQEGKDSRELVLDLSFGSGSYGLQITDEMLSPLIAHFGQGQGLNHMFVGCYNAKVTDLTPLRMAASPAFCQSLTKLEMLHFGQLTDEGMRAIAQLKMLTLLDLRGYGSDVSAVGIGYLAGRAKGESTRPSFGSAAESADGWMKKASPDAWHCNACDVDVKSDGTRIGDHVRSKKHKKKIDGRKPDSTDDDHDVAAGLLRLEYLNLSNPCAGRVKNGDFRGETFHHLAAFTNLKVLELEKGAEFNSYHFNFVVPKLKNVTVLNFRDCHAGGCDSSSFAVIAALGSLQKLDINGWGFNVDDKAMEVLASGACAKSLTHFDVGGNRVSDAGLNHIGTFTSLEYLDITHNKEDSITDAGITACLKDLTRLTELHMGGYSALITDASMTALPKTLKILRVNAPKLTSKGLEPVAKLSELKRVQILTKPSLNRELQALPQRKSNDLKVE